MWQHWDSSGHNTTNIAAGARSLHLKSLGDKYALKQDDRQAMAVTMPRRGAVANLQLSGKASELLRMAQLEIMSKNEMLLALWNADTPTLPRELLHSILKVCIALDLTAPM
jgi:hypothetical protein